MNLLRLLAVVACTVVFCITTAGCGLFELPTPEEVAQSQKEADDIAIDSALKDCKNGVYSISTGSEIVAAQCISLLKGNHHGQPMKILEQKGEVGGNTLLGGGTTATIGWIVIFEDLPAEKPVLSK